MLDPFEPLEPLEPLSKTSVSIQYALRVLHYHKIHGRKRLSH